MKGGYYEPEPNPQGRNFYKKYKAEYKFIINMLKRGYTQSQAVKLLNMENEQYPKTKLSLRTPHTYKPLIPADLENSKMSMKIKQELPKLDGRLAGIRTKIMHKRKYQEAYQKRDDMERYDKMEADINKLKDKYKKTVRKREVLESKSNKVILNPILKKDELTEEQKKLINQYTEKLNKQQVSDKAPISWLEFLKQHKDEYKNYNTLGEFTKAMSKKFYELKVDKAHYEQNPAYQYEKLKDRLMFDSDDKMILQVLIQSEMNEIIKQVKKTKKPYPKTIEAIEKHIADLYKPFVGYITYLNELPVTVDEIEEVYDLFIDDKHNKYGVNPPDESKFELFAQTIPEQHAKTIIAKEKKIKPSNPEKPLIMEFINKFKKTYKEEKAKPKPQRVPTMEEKPTPEYIALNRRGPERRQMALRHRLLRQLIKDEQATPAHKKEFAELEEVMKVILKGVEQGRGRKRNRKH